MNGAGGTKRGSGKEWWGHYADLHHEKVALAGRDHQVEALLDRHVLLGRLFGLTELSKRKEKETVMQEGEDKKKVC